MKPAKCKTMERSGFVMTWKPYDRFKVRNILISETSLAGCSLSMACLFLFGCSNALSVSILWCGAGQRGKTAWPVGPLVILMMLYPEGAG